MKNKTGLVSISFRAHTAEAILKEAVRSGLDAIEWGGDVHAPHGNIEEAKRVRELSEKYNIEIAEYGSYYFIGQSDPTLFGSVLESAEALGCQIIRVWPGFNKPSDTYSKEEYLNAVLDAKRICDLAKNVTVALECHPNSLTDEYHTALQFLRDVDKENLKMFWQPNQHRPHEYNIDAIKALYNYIVRVHVFSWDRNLKLPLDSKASEWKEYIRLLESKELYYMLEFMHDNSIDTLKETANTLKSWLK